MIHCASTMLALNSFCSAGSATFTTVPSMNAILEAITVATRIHGALVGVRGTVQGVARMTPASQGGWGNAVTESSRMKRVRPSVAKSKPRQELARDFGVAVCLG